MNMMDWTTIFAAMVVGEYFSKNHASGPKKGNDSVSDGAVKGKRKMVYQPIGNFPHILQNRDPSGILYLQSGHPFAGSLLPPESGGSKYRLYI